MTLRMPKDFQGGLQPQTGVSILNVELLAEQAASLGNAGRRVEAAVVLLKKISADDPNYPARRKDAADAVYSYFVQRELNGFTDHSDAIRH